MFYVNDDDSNVHHEGKTLRQNIFMSMTGQRHQYLSLVFFSGARENSTTSSVVSDGSEIDIDTETESEIETNVSEEFPHSSIFLLHNLNETIKWEKNRPFAPKFENRRSSSSFDKCRINGTDRLTPMLMKDDRMKSVTQVKGTHQQNLTVGQRRQRQSSNRETLLNKK